MEPSGELNPEPQDPVAGDGGCARCGESWSVLPAVVSTTLGVRVRRCRRCGSRATVEATPRFVVSCDVCCRVFLQERLVERASVECEDCAAGDRLERPESTVSEASQAEIREALDATCNFVRAKPLEDYLDGLVRALAERIEGTPAGARVVVLDHPSLVTLGLPSGEILFSIGMLRFLDDEAELAFVLAHELAHLASDAAAEHLCQVGFETLGRDESGELQQAWTRAAFEQVRLGYGMTRERRADQHAFSALRASGYDPQSALRLLERLRKRIDCGDELLAELAAAHPPAVDRMRKLDALMAGTVSSGSIERVNREVFRRAVSAALTPGTLQPTRLERAPEPTVRQRGGWSRLMIGAGVTGAVMVLVWWLIRLLSS